MLNQVTLHIFLKSQDHRRILTWGTGTDTNWHSWFVFQATQRHEFLMISVAKSSAIGTLLERWFQLRWSLYPHRATTFGEKLTRSRGLRLEGITEHLGWKLQWFDSLMMLQKKAQHAPLHSAQELTVEPVGRGPRVSHRIKHLSDTVPAQWLQKMARKCPKFDGFLSFCLFRIQHERN